MTSPKCTKEISTQITTNNNKKITIIKDEDNNAHNKSAINISNTIFNRTGSPRSEYEGEDVDESDVSNNNIIDTTNSDTTTTDDDDNAAKDDAINNSECISEDQSFNTSQKTSPINK